MTDTREWRVRKGIVAPCIKCGGAKEPGRGRKYCITCSGGVDLLKVPAKDRNRAASLRRYGLTESTYQAILDHQGGVCAICQKPPGKLRLAVDHDHTCCPKPNSSCGKCVRGLLCIRCNTVIDTFIRQQEEFIKYLNGD